MESMNFARREEDPWNEPGPPAPEPSPEPTEKPATSQVPVKPHPPIMTGPATTARREIPVTVHHEDRKNLEQRLRWHIAAWVVLFILLLASWFGFGAWMLSSDSALRSEGLASDQRLDKRIDDKDAVTQSKLESRATSLDTRVDQLLRDLAAARADLAALKTKVEAQEAMCQNACAASTK